MDDNQNRIDKINEIAADIYQVDFSFSSLDLRDKMRDLINNLSEQVAEYSEENTEFNYDRIKILMDDTQVTISKFGSEYTSDPKTNKQIVNENVEKIKNDVKGWVALISE